MFRQHWRRMFEKIHVGVVKGQGDGPGRQLSLTAQAGNGRPVFDVNLEDVEQAIALLQPGDLVLVKHHIPAGSAYWDHVEMYVGDGKTCGHGGPGAGNGRSGLPRRGLEPRPHRGVVALAA